MHMCWEDPEKLLEGDRSPRQLQSSDLLGLWSALEVGLAAHLRSYSDIGNMFRHSGLHVRPACDLLQLEAALSWPRRGQQVKHLADCAWYLAVKNHGACFGAGSWMVVCVCVLCVLCVCVVCCVL